MNFQQLRSVREAVRCGFNLTEVAHTLHTSQPGGEPARSANSRRSSASKLFVRAGKRLTGLTEPGGHVLPIIERMLLESSNLRACRAGVRRAAKRPAVGGGHALAGALCDAGGGAGIPAAVPQREAAPAPGLAQADRHRC